MNRRSFLKYIPFAGAAALAAIKARATAKPRWQKYPLKVRYYDMPLQCSWEPMSEADKQIMDELYRKWAACV